MGSVCALGYLSNERFDKQDNHLTCWMMISFQNLNYFLSSFLSAFIPILSFADYGDFSINTVNPPLLADPFTDLCSSLTQAWPTYLSMKYGMDPKVLPLSQFGAELHNLCSTPWLQWTTLHSSCPHIAGHLISVRHSNVKRYRINRLKRRKRMST